MLGFLFGIAIILCIVGISVLLSYIIEKLLENIIDSNLFLVVVGVIEAMCMLLTVWVFGNIMLSFTMGGLLW